MRAQTRNLIELLGLARHRGTYYLFMEDDFRSVMVHARRASVHAREI